MKAESAKKWVTTYLQNRPVGDDNVGAKELIYGNFKCLDGYEEEK
jgi:hypothetical protein